MRYWGKSWLIPVCTFDVTRLIDHLGSIIPFDFVIIMHSAIMLTKFRRDSIILSEVVIILFS